MVNSEATKIAKTKTELIEAIQFYLENLNVSHTERRKLLKKQIRKPLKGTSQRIAKTLKKWT